jgi:hypothetical protein
MNLTQPIRWIADKFGVRSSAPESTAEQMKEIIDLAEQFDRLQSVPGWEKVIKWLGSEVIGELSDAAKYKFDPVKRLTHVDYWNAKREMLDGLLGWMDSTQKERDRIVEEYRERIDHARNHDRN